MAKRVSSNHLYDPRHGGEAVRLRKFEVGSEPHEPARTNYFSIYLIDSGSGTFWADAAQFQFAPTTLLFFVPYQHIRLVPDSPVHGEIIQFHANFLCVETFHAEVGCSGILFNDPYGSPLVRMDQTTQAKLQNLINVLHDEQTEKGLAHGELMLAHLKVLLILSTRLKTSLSGDSEEKARDLMPPVLIELRELIEKNYCSLHAPADYAKLLHVTAKTLGRLVRERLGTTLTDLIRARILTHAKWQLLHTLRPVKEIAREVGFVDELYFSRLFKKGTGCSPTFFREFETEIRGGSNLSMVSSQSPILKSGPKADSDFKTIQN